MDVRQHDLGEARSLRYPEAFLNSWDKLALLTINVFPKDPTTWSVAQSPGKTSVQNILQGGTSFRPHEALPPIAIYLIRIAYFNIMTPLEYTLLDGGLFVTLMY